jgi:hypothetical protein
LLTKTLVQNATEAVPEDAAPWRRRGSLAVTLLTQIYEKVW